MESLSMVIHLRDDFTFIGVFIDVGGVFILKMQLLYTGWILGWSFPKLTNEKFASFSVLSSLIPKEIFGLKVDDLVAEQ